MQRSRYTKCCDGTLCSKLLQQDWFRRRRRGIEKLETNRGVLKESASKWNRGDNEARDKLVEDKENRREPHEVLKTHSLQNKTHGHTSHASRGITQLELVHLEVYLQENYFMFQ